MAEGDETGGLFSLCSIAFVRSASLTPKVIGELSGIVESHGAEVLEPSHDGSVRMDHVTHIISNTIDFPQFTESQALMIPVVTSQWITSSIARNKQAQVRPFSPDPRMIFSRVILTCADLPIIDKETIIGATMALGGMETKDVTRQTTHICALSMDHPKCIMAVEKGIKAKIVLPHWFDDCFKLGKRIDEGPYLLPDPEILRANPEDEVKVPHNEHLDGATSTNPDYLPPPPTNGSRTPVTIFKSKNVMLSWDLAITTRLKNICKQLIEEGGGRVVDSVEFCDIFICQYREGDQYIRASHLGKDVGNLAWLYYLITHNEWTSPLRRLLHYPVPKNGIPGFENFRIVISNYGGEARIYLENLIKATGATYTKTMKAENTHLITARNSSEKYEAAKDWGIDAVNHLWIEESYAKCEVQPIAVAKYTHFPLRTNLGEIIGQTFFDEARLREKHYPGGEEALTSSAKRKRNVLEAAQNNAHDRGPAAGIVIGQQEHKEFDVMKDSAANYADKSKKKFGVSAPPKDDSYKTPVRARHVRTGKENDTPSVMSTGSRSAKNKALSNLQKIAPDIALYEKEKKRASKDGPWGGKRAADQIDKKMAARSSSPAHGTSDAGADADESRPAKKQKHRPSLPDVDLRVVLTGFTRWVGNKDKEDVDRRKLRGLGIQIVQDTQPCDFLAAPQMVRTIKFLRALAQGPTVISSAFIEHVLDTGKVPDPEDFILQDVQNESKFGIKLKTAVARARANRGKLLVGVPVYCTANIRNGPESYKAIAEANGAIFMLYRARSLTIKPTTAEEDGGAPPDPVYLLSSNSPDERQLWPRFIEMAERGHMEPRIVSADWLLDVAMKQQVMFDEKYSVKNFFG